MATRKVGITLEKELVQRLDQLVAEGRYASRSRAIQEAIRQRLAEERRARMLDQVDKLSPEEERALAEEGLSEEASEWPEY